MFDIVLFFILGLLIGAIAGVIPSIHPNFISAIVILQDIDYVDKATLIVSMYASHLVFSYIPSIFFGIPDEQTAVSVLPGQRMVLEGNGILAIKITTVSILVASITAAALIPIAIQFYPICYEAIKNYLVPILIVVSCIFVLRTKNPYRSLLIFLVSGVFGFYALRMEMNDAFLPIFSGFFAMGAILNYKKTKIPKQNEKTIDLEIVKFALLGTLFGGLANLIPAISSQAQIAALISVFIAFETGNYLATVAAIGVGQFIFAFASSASIEKARHGVIINLGTVLDIGANMQMLLLCFLFGIGISAIILFFLRKKISNFAKIDFSKFNKALAIYLALVIFLINGFAGLVIFAIASLIGYATIKLNVERTIMMGGVIIPTILLIL